MAAPEGYVALDLIGFTDKGDYAAGTTYVKNDLVHSDNRIYLSLQDNNVGNVLPVLPATETTYWKLWLSGGSDNLDDLTAKDTSNLMGTGAGQVVVAQALIDAMASKIVQQNSDLTGEVTIVVGTNDYSSLKRKGNICVAQISIILTEFTPWQEAKIATVSYLPVSGLQRNIVIYDTATGNAINGRLTLNILGEVSLYTTAPIPDSASLKECFTYICQ